MADAILRQLEREYSQGGGVAPLLRYYRRIGHTVLVKPLVGIGPNKNRHTEEELWTICPDTECKHGLLKRSRRRGCKKKCFRYTGVANPCNHGMHEQCILREDCLCFCHT